MIDGYYQSFQTPKQPPLNSQTNHQNFGQNQNHQSENMQTTEEDIVNSINQQLLKQQDRPPYYNQNMLYRMFTNKKKSKLNEKGGSSEFSSQNSDQMKNFEQNQSEEERDNQSQSQQKKESNSSQFSNIEMSNMNVQQLKLFKQSSCQIQERQEGDECNQQFNKKLTKRMKNDKGNQSQGSQDDDDEGEDEEDYQSQDLPQGKTNWQKSFLNETLENVKIKSSSFMNRSASFNLKNSDNFNISGDLIQSKDGDSDQQQQTSLSSIASPFVRKQNKRTLSFALPSNRFGNNMLGSNNIIGNDKIQNMQGEFSQSMGQLTGVNQRMSVSQQSQSPQIQQQSNLNDKNSILKVYKNQKQHYFLQKCFFYLNSFYRFKKLSSDHFKAMDKSAVNGESDQDEQTLTEYAQQQFKYILISLLQVIPVISPSSHFKNIWDVCQMIVQVYTFWILPISISTGRDLYDLVGDPISHITIPVFLLLDLIVSMNTGYNKNGATVLEKDKIIDHYYYEGGLTFDILSLISIICLSFRKNHIHENFDNYYDPTTYLLLIYFVKYFQFCKTAKKVEDRLDLSPKKKNALSLFNLLVNVLFISHLFASIWIFIGRQQQLMIGDSYLNKRTIYNLDWYDWYIQTIYYVVVTMTTVGYGDIVPATNTEFIVSIGIMLFACGIFAYNVNAIGAILDEFYRQKRIIDEKMAVINAYMSRHNINLNLRYQIRDYLENFWIQSAEKHEEMESMIINDLPKYLQKNLIEEVNHVVLKKSPIFRKNFSRNVCMRLSHILKEVHYPPNQLICSKDTQDDNSIYFIRNGTVQISYFNPSQTHQNTHQNQQNNGQNNQQNQTNGAPHQPSPQTSFLITNPNNQGQQISQQINNQNATPQFSQSFYNLKNGDSFGELSFFTGQNRSATVRAVDFTTLIKIERQEFIQLLSTSPADYEKFCFIKDRIMFKQAYQDIGVKCYSCQRYDHLISQCPVIHLVPNKYITLLKYNYNPENKERVKHDRSDRAKFHSITETEILKTAAQELYPDGNFDFQSGDELESTESSGSSSQSSSQSNSDEDDMSQSSKSDKSHNSKKSVSFNNSQNKMSHFQKFSEKQKSISEKSGSDSSDQSSQNSNSDSDDNNKKKSKSTSQSLKKLSSSNQLKTIQGLNKISETKKEQDFSDSDQSQKSCHINPNKKIPLGDKFQIMNSKNKQTKEIEFNSNSKQSSVYDKNNNKIQKNSLIKKGGGGQHSSFSSKSSSMLVTNQQNDQLLLSPQMCKNNNENNKNFESKDKQTLKNFNMPDENNNQQTLMKLFQKLVDKFIVEENEGQTDQDQNNQSNQMVDIEVDFSQDFQIYYPQYNQANIIKKYNDLTAKQNQSAFVMAFQISKKQDIKETEQDSPTKSKGRSSVFLKFNPRFSIAPAGLR
ncbi:cyclic nucleotide-binding domain protein (macronuclear) [Tetrahymena thermophila SB210]|uniref:Cyclic nucleotide-binding domain protein n=1 Tax=Tetrahymena thermophila (strain SB210) TaxID=312017 RepID=Q22XL7_TETTS|nr:cyclic nucleotide-binding domain protein [Tetrahymena thermophila SB210]EAR89993.2 cyclic nucleotide-binding domain protein [Tetrahymena thermophila SB210]|eukprot:XP_001010238.2 cyclic nucleotide-binding domain protein [Tetrahymena thermophila SB210]